MSHAHDIITQKYGGDRVCIQHIRDTYGAEAGYHMNKKHWYTICLDGSVPIEEIYERIRVSFSTLKK